MLLTQQSAIRCAVRLGPPRSLTRGAREEKGTAAAAAAAHSSSSSTAAFCFFHLYAASRILRLGAMPASSGKM